jgi:mannosyltransferase
VFGLALDRPALIERTTGTVATHSVARYAPLGAILVAAAAIRLAGLDRDSLWADEGASLYFAQSASTWFIDTNPPLYYVFLHFWVGLVGAESDFLLRVPSVLFGVGSIGLAYVLAEWLAGRKAAIWAGCLLAASSLHIWYAQEARAYSLFTFLAVASMFGFVALIENAGPRTAVWYVLPSSLLMYAHPYGPFLIASQWVFVAASALARRLSRAFGLWWLAAQAVVLVTFTPWIVSMVLHPKLQATRVLAPIEFGMLKETIFEYANESKILGWLLLAVIGVGLIMCVIRRPRRAVGTELLLLTWAAGTIVLGAVISYLWLPIYFPRYTIAASVGFYLLVAFVLARVRSNLATGLLALVIAGLMAPGVIAYYQQPHKEQWRDAVQVVEAQAPRNGLVLFDLMSPNLFERYAHRTDLAMETVDSRAVSDNPAVLAALKTTTNGRSEVWLIRPETPNRTDGLISLMSEFEVVDNRQLVHLELVRLARRTS